MYVNGFRLNDNQFTIDDFETITLTQSVNAGTDVQIVIYKSVDGEKAETVIEQVEKLQLKVAELEEVIQGLQNQAG